jgi:hypothetical protein
MANQVTYTQSPFNKSRKDKFTMVLSLPGALLQKASKFNRGTDTILPDTLQFSIYGNIVPEINVPAIETRYSGQTLTQSSHSRTPYEPNTVNFTVDNRFNNYWVIYTWLNLLNDAKEGGYDIDGITSKEPIGNNKLLSFGSNYDYKSDITIFGLDEYNKRVVEFKYIQAFPINLGGISYNYRDGGEIESQFTYSYSQLIITPITEFVS